MLLSFLNWQTPKRRPMENLSRRRWTTGLAQWLIHSRTEKHTKLKQTTFASMDWVACWEGQYDCSSPSTKVLNGRPKGIIHLLLNTEKSFRDEICALTSPLHRYNGPITLQLPSSAVETTISGLLGPAPILLKACWDQYHKTLFPATCCCRKLCQYFDVWFEHFN